MKYKYYSILFIVLSCLATHAQDFPDPDPPLQSYYRDMDCDGLGAGEMLCCTIPPEGEIGLDPDGNIIYYCYSLVNGDCDDTNRMYPKTFYYDGDGDGYGRNDSNYTRLVCSDIPPLNFVSNNKDCDDTNRFYYATIWYPDNDGDGYGTDSGSIATCNAYNEPGFARHNMDCDDDDAFVNPNTQWYLDTNNDNIFSELDGPPTHTQCTSPGSNYVRAVNNRYNWTHTVQYDAKGTVTGASRTYFDDLGKPNVTLSKDVVQNKIWGTETVYDSFNRADKSSFIAPSPSNIFDKTRFLKAPAGSSPGAPDVTPDHVTITAPIVFVDDPFSEPITPDPFPPRIYTVKAKQTITASSAITSTATMRGFNVTFTSGGTITLSPGFNVTPSSFEDTFQAVIPTIPPVDEVAQTALANYYSDSNILEPYQATATHPYAQANYDTLNPGNTINVIGGNKIDGEWKTGYAYTVPAAQEMYYVYGSGYYDGSLESGNEEVITKFYKSVSVDANGVENVAFSDGEGKVLAAARSGGPLSYPVVSVIGTQGFVDVHIPAGIAPSQINLIGGASLYRVYDLKTGAITTALTGGNAYRIEAITTPVTDPKTYIANGVPIYSSGALGITYSVNYYDYAVNIYNKTGQLIRSVQPNGYQPNATIVAVPAHMDPAATGFNSTFTYNTMGQVTAATSADEGNSKFAYRNDGQIRYSQSALQAATKVSYTDYDSYGRPIESGVITATWADAAANPDGGLVAGARSEQTFTIYDDADNNTTSTVLPPNLTLSAVLDNERINPAQYQQKNLSGNVAVTFTKPGAGITAITWYSYDIYGRAEWMVQYHDGIGAKTIHYEYDHKGNAKKVLYQKDKAAELFTHRYTYDANDVLTKVETSTDNTTFITHADYSYYLTGELKRVNLAQGAQGIDYVYTLGGALKSINHPSLDPAKDPGGDANDVFGVTLDYYNGDYLRTGRNITTATNIVGANQDFNGNIKAARWANKGIPGDYTAGIANQKGYLYNYDRNNWLSGATFGTASASTITPTNSFTEGGLTYDPNGNIRTLQRSNNAGTTTDQLTYNYSDPGKNRLNSLTEAAAVTADATDIENQAPDNYVYDAIGQLINNVNENTRYVYNTQGLVTEVWSGRRSSSNRNPIVKFYYNERGQRIKKESYTEGRGGLILVTNYYIPDLSGNVMAIYTSITGGRFGNGTIIQKELPIFGLSRLGVYNKEDNSSSYQITDHLGNVRAVIKKINGNPVIQSYADYYPFGEQLPERNSTSGYRYAFQGQEKDPETGMEAFQLRLWDGRIGRWLSPDPYGQYDSPYLGMGNNPVSMIDPDGGFASGPGDPGKGFWGRVWGGIKSAFGGGNSEITYQGEKLEGVVINREPINAGAPRLIPIDSPTWRVIPGGGSNPAPNPFISSRFLPALIMAVFYTPDTSPYSPTNSDQVLNPDSVDKKNNDFAQLRVQLQKGNLNIASTTAINTPKVGVTVLQADVALVIVRENARDIEKKLISSTQAIHAFKKMSTKIARAPTGGGIIGGTRTTLQETFMYKGEVFRIDVESLRGHNLRQ